jgi:hypothetical protein
MGQWLNRAMSKWYKILPAVLLLVALVLGVWLGVRILQVLGGGSSPRLLTTPTLIRQVQSLAQLVTIKYVMEKVVVLEDVKWYGENRLLLVAHGVVKAGVDLSQLKPDDLQTNNNKIMIRLPRAMVTDVYLDEKQTRIIERTTGLLRNFDMHIEQNARQIAVDDIRRAARQAGILEDADERTRQIILRLFQQLGYNSIEFR